MPLALMLRKLLVPCLTIGRVARVQLRISNWYALRVRGDVLKAASARAVSGVLLPRRIAAQSKHLHVLVQPNQARIAEWRLILARLVEHLKLRVVRLIGRVSLGIRGALGCF